MGGGIIPSRDVRTAIIIMYACGIRADLSGFFRRGDV